MKIKIIKADKDKWYANRIGKTYVVMKVWDLPSVVNIRTNRRTRGKCFVIRNYRTILRTIAFNDAEIIEE